MEKFLIFVLIAIVVMVIIIGGMVVASTRKQYPIFRDSDASGKLDNHPTYGPIRRASKELGAKNQLDRHQTALDEIDRHHIGRSRRRLKWLRGESLETITADREREIGIMSSRLKLARQDKPTQQRKAHLGSLHPKTGDIRGHGIGRAGHGTRALIPKQESPIIRAIRGNKNKKKKS